MIVAYFYDVESGRMDLDDCGCGSNYERFAISIARDGGITNLLDEAADPGCRFDVVLCEGISRVARRAYEGLSVERALERADVSLFAVNKPIIVTGSRAQRILQRRINQSVSGYGVLNTSNNPGVGCAHTCARAGHRQALLRLPREDLSAPEPGYGRPPTDTRPASNPTMFTPNRRANRGVALLRRHRRTAQHRSSAVPTARTARRARSA